MLLCTLVMKKKFFQFTLRARIRQNLPQNCARHVMNGLATSITHRDKNESDQFGLVDWSYFNLILTVFYNDMAALVIQS